MIEKRGKFRGKRWKKRRGEQQWKLSNSLIFQVRIPDISLTSCDASQEPIWFCHLMCHLMWDSIQIKLFPFHFLLPDLWFYKVTFLYICHPSYRYTFILFIWLIDFLHNTEVIHNCKNVSKQSKCTNSFFWKSNLIFLIHSEVIITFLDNNWLIITQDKKSSPSNYVWNRSHWNWWMENRMKNEVKLKREG